MILVIRGKTRKEREKEMHPGGGGCGRNPDHKWEDGRSL